MTEVHRLIMPAVVVASLEERGFLVAAGRDVGQQVEDFVQRQFVEQALGHDGRRRLLPFDDFGRLEHDRLGLQQLKQPWDALYAERSTLVHGLAPQPGADYGDLAHRTISLCGQILLKAAAAEIPQADRHVTRMYVG